MAEHTHMPPTRSAGALTLTSPWRAFPTVTWSTASQSPLKWHTRVHPALNPMHLIQIIPQCLYPALSFSLSLLSPLHPSSSTYALSTALSLAERSQVLPPCDFPSVLLSSPSPSHCVCTCPYQLSLLLVITRLSPPVYVLVFVCFTYCLLLFYPFDPDLKTCLFSDNHNDTCNRWKLDCVL